MIPEVNHLLFHISKGRFYKLALMGFCSLCDHPDPRRDRGPFSTLQLSKLNALFESAQCPSWVGSTPLVSRLKWRFELRGNDLADPNNDKCLCMCHTMTVFCGQNFPNRLYYTYFGIACRMALCCVRSGWRCVACVPDGVALRAFQMASTVISEWKVYRTAIVIFGNLSEINSRWKSL